jgi:hypothetical protein
MLNTNKLYKQLKNGKQVQIFYKLSNFHDYTIWLSFKNEIFTLHSFHVAGNDVFNDNSYQDEQIENFENFKALSERVIEKYPGITYP